MNTLDLLAAAGRWSIEPVWIPMLVWTIVALTAYFALRAARRTSPEIRYRAYGALILALPAGLAAAAVASMAGMLSAAPDVAHGLTLIMLPEIVGPTVPAATGGSSAWTLYHVAGAALLVALACALVRMAQLAQAYVHLRRFASSIANDAPPSLCSAARELARAMDVTREVRIVVSDAEDTPLTFGWLRPTIVLPRRILHEHAELHSARSSDGSRAHAHHAHNDLELALTHELIHVRRHDYLFQWIEQLVGAAFAIHPLVALVRREMAMLREVTCDAHVLQRTGDRSRYARLLYRYSAPASRRWQPAVGIQAREPHLKTRIAAMKELLDLRQLDRTRRIGLVASVALLVFAITAIACAELLVDAAPATDEAAVDARTTEPETFVVVEQMPELIGGLASIQQQITYPESAREAGAEGRVFIQFVVDEQGNVVEPVITRGVHQDLDAIALNALQQARFNPGRQRGVPVRVRMSIPITFRLSTPTQPANEGSAGDAAHILIDIDRNGAVTLAGRRVAPEEIGSRLLALSPIEADRLALRVYRGAPLDVVLTVQEEMRSTGLSRIRLDPNHDFWTIR